MHQVGAHPLFLRVISWFVCVFGAQVRVSGNAQVVYFFICRQNNSATCLLISGVNRDHVLSSVSVVVVDRHIYQSLILHRYEHYHHPHQNTDKLSQLPVQWFFFRIKPFPITFQVLGSIHTEWLHLQSWFQNENQLQNAKYTCILVYIVFPFKNRLPDMFGCLT